MLGNIIGAYLFRCCHILSHIFKPAFIGCGGGPGGPGGGPLRSRGPLGPPGLGIELGVEMGGGGGGPPEGLLACEAAAAIAAFMLAACRPIIEWKGWAPWNCGLSPNILSKGGMGGKLGVWPFESKKLVECTTIQIGLSKHCFLCSIRCCLTETRHENAEYQSSLAELTDGPPEPPTGLHLA